MKLKQNDTKFIKNETINQYDLDFWGQTVVGAIMLKINNTIDC